MERYIRISLTIFLVTGIIGLFPIPLSGLIRLICVVSIVQLLLRVIWRW